MKIVNGNQMTGQIIKNDVHKEFDPLSKKFDGTESKLGQQKGSYKSLLVSDKFNYEQFNF
jgi:hypothetical protein